jgi:hypothetical protein
MKKEELKQIIKPLIKECLKEVLVEEGFAKMLSETKQSLPVQEIKKPVQQSVNIKPTALLEAKKKMLDAIGNTGFDAFANTQPLQEDKEIVGNDPGIDISKLLENKQVWKQTLNAMNGKKVKE